MKAIIASVCFTFASKASGANHRSTPTTGPTTNPIRVLRDVFSCAAKDGFSCASGMLTACVVTTFLLRHTTTLAVLPEHACPPVRGKLLSCSRTGLILHVVFVFRLPCSRVIGLLLIAHLLAGLAQIQPRTTVVAKCRHRGSDSYRQSSQTVSQWAFRPAMDAITKLILRALNESGTLMLVTAST
jgi:hypothetical protein